MHAGMDKDASGAVGGGTCSSSSDECSPAPRREMGSNERTCSFW
jgi:hypothetical protein